MGKLVDADVPGSGGDPLEAGIGADGIQGKEQTPVANVMGFIATNVPKVPQRILRLVTLAERP